MSLCALAPAAAGAAEDSSGTLSFEVAEYQRVFGGTPERAEANLALQQDAAGIVDHLRAVLGDDYSGVWFDNAAGEFVVPRMAETRLQPIGDALSNQGAADDFRTPVVASTWIELESAQRIVGKRLAGLFEKGDAISGIDPRENAVVLQIAKGAAPQYKAQAEALAKEMTAIEVEQVQGQDLRTADLGCDAGLAACTRPLRAGVGIQRGKGAYEPVCTAAFKAVGVGPYQNRFMLTAGHCAQSGQIISAFNPENSNNPEKWRTEEIGWVEQSDEAPNDWAKIRANGTFWDASPWPTQVAYWGTNTNHPINGESASYVGQWVCQAGMAVKASCGYVQQLNVESDIAPGQGRLHQTMFGPTCIAEGNSGGPVFAGNVALGILSSEIEPHVKPCWGQFALYSEITEAADALGVSVGPRLGTVPYAETGAAVSIARRSVTLTGIVAPHNITSNYYFDYGTTEAYGQVSFPGAAGSGWGKIPIFKNLTQLQPNTEYHYRLVAENSAGKAYSYDEDFTTLHATPYVTVLPASNLTATGATLRGEVNPDGFSTGYHFEYGTSSNKYSTSFPIPDKGIGSGFEDVAVSADITGLKPETTYYYRLVATSSEGTTGNDPNSVPLNGVFTTHARTPTYLNSFGSPGSSAGQFSRPLSLAADDEGNVFVLDKQNGRVQKFNAIGEFLMQFGSIGSGNGQLKDPLCIHIGPDGSIWVCDAGNRRLVKFSAGGQFIRNLGPSFRSGEMIVSPIGPWQPNGLAIDSESHVWVTEPGDSRVREFSEIAGSPALELRRTFGTNDAALQTPANMAMNEQRTTVVFADPGANKVFSMSTLVGDPNGPAPILGGFGEAGSGPGQLSQPFAVAVKPSGAVLVSDRGNNRIQQFKGGNYLGVQFGTSGSGAGQFSEPGGVALSASGLVFVADTGNNRVQRWGQQAAPDARTQAPSSVTGKSATLKALVNPSGLATNYRYEYGMTTSYGTTTPVGGASLSAGFETTQASAAISGLQPEATYHYRVVASNAEGTDYGADRMFTTTQLQPSFVSAFGSAGGGPGQMQRPFGTAIDPSGNIWVVDRENNRVQKFDSNGNFVSQFGSTGSGNGQFNDPRGITISAAGNVWISEIGNKRLQEFNSKGEFIRKVTYGEFSEPYGLATGPGEVLWVTDVGTDRLFQFKEDGSFIRKIGGTGHGFPAMPSAVDIDTDPAGNAWVSDNGALKIIKLSPTGSFITQWGTAGGGPGQFNFNMGVEVTPWGDLLVSENGGGRIQEFKPDGTFVLEFGGAGSGPGKFSEPRGLVVAADGTTYIADAGNKRVQRWEFK